MVDSLALLRFGGTQPAPYCWLLAKECQIKDPIILPVGTTKSFLGIIHPAAASQQLKESAMWTLT
jgi:hypothetical protein